MSLFLNREDGDRRDGRGNANNTMKDNRVLWGSLSRWYGYGGGISKCAFGGHSGEADQARANADGADSHFDKPGQILGLSAHFSAEGEGASGKPCGIGQMLEQRPEDGAVGVIVVGYLAVVAVDGEEILNQVV